MADNDKPLETAEDYFKKGDECFKKGDYDGAVACYDEATHRDPSLAQAAVDRMMAIGMQRNKELFGQKYEEKIEQKLEAAVRQITADTKDFRDSYNDHKALSEKLRKWAMFLLGVIGMALLVGLLIIYCIEKDSLSAWGLLPWLPIMTVISAPFFLLWWMLQRWSYEALTLAYGFQRKAIVEERVFLYAGDDAELRKELLKIYVVHWMEKSPLEVMLTIGGKKGMGGGTSPTAALLGKLAEKAGDGISKTGKDGAS